MNQTIRTTDAEGTRRLGHLLGMSLSAGDVVALIGPLGAGKTVFAQGIAEALNITEPVTSPTYTLISEYKGKFALYHMDLYRLDNPEEFVWLGVEEMLGGQGICLIEWAERAIYELPDETIHVNIDIAENGDRIFVLPRNLVANQVS